MSPEDLLVVEALRHLLGDADDCVNVSSARRYFVCVVPFFAQHRGGQSLDKSAGIFVRDDLSASEPVGRLDNWRRPISKDFAHERDLCVGKLHPFWLRGHEWSITGQASRLG